jgi:hypothetical protein
VHYMKLHNSVGKNVEFEAVLCQADYVAVSAAVSELFKPIILLHIYIFF